MDMLARIEIVQIYYKCNRSDAKTLREYKKIHCMKYNPFTLAAIRKTISRFENTGSIHLLIIRATQI